MTTASPAAGISPEFIDQIRTKLARTTVEHYINGQWTEGARGETFETLDPSTNRVLARAWRGHSEDIDRAAQAAHAAFQKWGHGKAKDRKKFLLKIASLIEKHGDELATIECLDAGQALKIVRAQIARTAENFSFYAEYAEKAMDGRTYPVDHDWLNYSLRVPIGPCGIITPWNAPMMLSTWRIAPALATGNTVILKPAEWSPLTAWKLAQIFEEADLPPGVFNVVQGFGEESGAPLVAHPLVPLITFTGETTTGSIVMKTGADQLKRLSLELGGKSPAVIFADADLDRALDATIFQIYSFNGERCTANSRALIEECDLRRIHRGTGRSRRARQSGQPARSRYRSRPTHPSRTSRPRAGLHRNRQKGRRQASGGWRARGFRRKLRLPRPVHGRKSYAHRAGGNLRPGSHGNSIQRRSRRAHG